MISPLMFFAVLLAGTIGLFLAHLAARRIHRERLTSLAREWRMHYAHDDRFNLAPRVAERLALPGAADVRVVDLIYGTDDGTRRYVFSVQYTKGVLRQKKRMTCVASLTEIKNDWSALHVVEPAGPLIDRYRAAADAVVVKSLTPVSR